MILPHRTKVAVGFLIILYNIHLPQQYAYLRKVDVSSLNVVYNIYYQKCLHRQSICSTRVASHLAVNGFQHSANVGKIPKNDKMGVVFHMFIDVSLLFSNCLSFVYTHTYILPLILCFMSIILGLDIPVCGICECLIYFPLVPGLGNTEGSFYWIFATTLTYSPVHCLSQISPPSSSTLLTPLDQSPQQAQRLILKRWSAVMLVHIYWRPISFWFSVYIYKA